MPNKIEIKHELKIDELFARLRNVGLRGFPHVKVYKDSQISLRSLSPEQVRNGLFTPQPSVYTSFLDRIAELADLFRQEGINIFSLSGGYDYTTTNQNGEITDWTMIPPVVEVFPLRFNPGKGLDYSALIGSELASLMKEQSHSLNPELRELDFPEFIPFRASTTKVAEICDGSHRVEMGVRKGLTQTVLIMHPTAEGFPYYAAPKPYSTVHDESDREKSDKTHVLTSPGHKLLYRVFPSGGIFCGTVRPPTSKETFI